ncbi:MAG: alcohol dehydrogenase catalytic domain-containing protein [Pseudomonadota bacterium]|nr:alcohol dehydrogenase catalytic domain-containing protein [Pseudomonadota bacterium]
MASKTMRAARLHRVGEAMVVDQVPVPPVRPTDVRVKVQACNIVPNLHNILANWQVWNPHLPLPRLPAVFGLDASGVIDEVGTLVQHFKPGDRVYFNPGMGCGSCVPCLAGHENECANYVFVGYFGFGPDSQRLFDAYPFGGLAEYLIAPQKNLVRLPANVSFEQAARFGYLGTSFAALKRSKAGPGSTLVIDGATGTLGLGAVLNALALNVGRILGTARNKELLSRVRALNPERIETWSLDEGPAGPWIRRQTGGLGADAALNCLGPGSPATTVLDTLYALRRGGRFVNIGGTSGPIPIDLFRLMAAQIDIVGNNWFLTSQAQEMAYLAEAGRLDLSVFEHKRFALADINAALASIPDRSGGFTNLVVSP